MIVDVRGAVVIGSLLVLVVFLVSMDQRRVVVLMLMVVSAMLELAQRTAGVVMRHVVVVVAVHVGRVRMLVLFVAHHVLASRQAGVRFHGWALPCSILP